MCQMTPGKPKDSTHHFTEKRTQRNKKRQLLLYDAV